MAEWGGFPSPSVAKRPAAYPGPRCATHHRERRKIVRDQSHAMHIEVTYGITKAQYDQLLESQEGRCYICRRATGASRKLAVDHDHKSGHVRGLLCSTCNKLLGHLRDDLKIAERIYTYLHNPPAFKVIGYVKPDDST